MHDLSYVYTPAALGFVGTFFPFFVIAMFWTIILKGFALWHAARGSQKWWFVALLVINTVGILEIIYLIWFRPGASADLAKLMETPKAEPAASEKAL